MGKLWIPFYTGDYERDTMALTILQDGAYFRLLRYVWATGEPIPDIETAYIIGRARNQDERDAIAFVIEKFFTKKSKGFFNKKADEIAKSQKEKSLKAARSAKSRWNANAYADHNAIAMLPDPDPEIKKEKLKKEKKSPMGDEAEFETWWKAYPAKIAKAHARKAYDRARKTVDFKTILSGLERYKATKPAYADWKHPATWLNGGCWEDQPAGSNQPEKPKTHAQKVKEHLEAGGKIQDSDGNVWTLAELEWTNPDTRHSSHFARDIPSGDYLYWSQVKILGG